MLTSRTRPLTSNAEAVVVTCMEALIALRDQLFETLDCLATRLVELLEPAPQTPAPQPRQGEQPQQRSESSNSQQEQELGRLPVTTQTTQTGAPEQTAASSDDSIVIDVAELRHRDHTPTPQPPSKTVPPALAPNAALLAAAGGVAAPPLQDDDDSAWISIQLP
jgi:hypothetical protein